MLHPYGHPADFRAGFRRYQGDLPPVVENIPMERLHDLLDRLVHRLEVGQCRASRRYCVLASRG